MWASAQQRIKQEPLWEQWGSMKSLELTAEINKYEQASFQTHSMKINSTWLTLFKGASVGS